MMRDINVREKQNFPNKVSTVSGNYLVATFYYLQKSQENIKSIAIFYNKNPFFSTQVTIVLLQ